MNRLRAFFRTRTGRLILHDGTFALGSGFAAWDAAGHSFTWGALSAAGYVAAKSFLRVILPVPSGTRGKAGPADVRKRRISEVAVPGRPLGRHVHHDERSRAFAVRESATGTLRSVRHARHVPPFDQGEVGSCTGNAGAGALSTSPFTHRYTEVRALKLYSAAETIDGDGPYPPNDNGSSGLSIAKACKAQGLVRAYYHCFTPEAVYTALQTGPVMLGVTWLTGYDDPAGDGRMTHAGKPRGGHEIVADELDVENRRIWITNSWGAAWGVRGRAYWTWDDFTKILADEGDATVLER